LKNVVVNWYGEITLEILKGKTIKSIRINPHLDILIMNPLDINFLTNTKKIISKGLFKIRSNSDLSKVHKYYLVKVSQKNDFTLNFIISFFNPFLIPINNLE
jgi:hypothetical protein